MTYAFSDGFRRCVITKGRRHKMQAIVYRKVGHWDRWHFEDSDNDVGVWLEFKIDFACMWARRRARSRSDWTPVAQLPAARALPKTTTPTPEGAGVNDLDASSASADR